MKTFRLIGMALVAILLCSTSCSSDDVVTPEQQEPKEYTVSLGLSGEILEITQSPLSRAEEEKNDLYGIQVYSTPNDENSTNKTPYAYGLFDDVSSLSIKLLEGYKYSFEVTMLKEGKEKIYSSFKGYEDPFRIDSYTACTISEEFIFSDKKIGNLAFGVGWLSSDNKCYYRPNIDRYYGLNEGYYIPEKDGKVTINMKRASFGAKFIAEGLTEGSLLIEMDESPLIEINHPESEFNDIYSFASLGWVSEKDDYTETVPTTIQWIKADNAIVPLGKHNITFQRNKLTTVKIIVKDSSINNGVDIELESEGMGEGDNKTIENGSIKDTPVQVDSN